MKKFIFVLVALLLVSWVTYGADYWYSPNPTCIRPISGYTHVGIGTNNPAAELHVNGTALMTGFKLITGAHSGYVLTSDGSGVGTWKPATSGGSCLWSGDISKIYYNGNVGIGTTSPAEKLHVNGSVRGNQSGALRISTGNGYVDIGPKNSSYAHFYTDRSKFYFDKELQVNTGYIGSYNGNLSLRTQGTTRMTILNTNGYVGIGTSQPSQLLDLRNDDMRQIEFDRTANSAISNLFYIGPSAGGDVDHLGIHTSGSAGNNMVVFKSNGRVGIGTTTPFGPLSVKTASNHNLVVENCSTGVRVAVSQDNGNDNEELVLSGGLGEDHVTIHRSGNVGIGTTDPGSYKLAVNGHIRTKEITVESDWSDFVFEENYQLMPLEKLEKHIKENKSLPGIPAEKEVKENGVEVGEMQAKLLEKVEELTLYMINLKKENEELRKTNENLEKRISALED